MLQFPISQSSTLGAAVALVATVAYLFIAQPEIAARIRFAGPLQPPSQVELDVDAQHERSTVLMGAVGKSCSANGVATRVEDASSTAAMDTTNTARVTSGHDVRSPQSSTGCTPQAALEETSSHRGQLELMALSPGQLVGPYRLQEHLGYLGRRPVHDHDPAFHPHEAKRIDYYGREMIFAPAQPPVCPIPWGFGHEHGRAEGGAGALVLAVVKETDAGEGSYRLHSRFEGGSHGEVWRGVRLGPDGEPLSAEGYILKRMLLEKGQHVMQAGLREIYFGELLAARRGSPRVARYVEHLYLFGEHGTGRFGRAGQQEMRADGNGWKAGAVPTEMWLVFRDEGVSLRHYLYTEREARGFVLHGQSNFWRDMRLDPKGPEVMKSILRQTLQGTRFLHERGILHRDLKPSNLIVSLPPSAASPDAAAAKATPVSTPAENPTGGGAGGIHDVSPPLTVPVAGADRAETWKRQRRGSGDRKSRAAGGDDQGFSKTSATPPVLLKLADFSSAVNEGAIAAGLYGTAGPAQAEETLLYAPPEVLFDPKTAFSEERPESYDVWSIGVLLLELILGTPEVFTVDQRTRAILDRDLAFEDEAAREKAHLLAAMADMCIYSRSGHVGGQSVHRQRSAARKGGGASVGHSEGQHWPLGNRAVVDERCTLTELGKAIHTRDALDIGFPDQWGLDLLWRFLRWDPLERISVTDALEHAYFTGPYRSLRDGSAHATHREAMRYDGWFTGSPRVPPSAVTLRPPMPYAALWGSAASRGDPLFDEGVVSLGWEGRHASGLIHTPASKGPSEGAFMLDHQHTLDVHYTCPKCNRTFELWKSCHNHVTGRSHASFCDYDTSSLPPCVSSHSMLPFDPHSGWCDVQGRRSRIEDFHSIVFQEQYKFYGVFDGHCGTRAAKFASRALHLNVELFLSAQDHVEGRGSGSGSEPDRNAFVERAVRAAFDKTQREFLQLAGGAAGPAATFTVDMGAETTPPLGDSRPSNGSSPRALPATAAAAGDDSGTTATIALVYPNVTVVAHVGDSRAVMCCDDSGHAVDITEDHTPYSAGERRRVEDSGGSVEHRGVLRVNGELAVTRSLGNRRLSRDGVLSSEPDVVFVSHEDRGPAANNDSPERDRGGRGTGSGGGEFRDSGVGSRRATFLVLASDGLWDAVSSQEAVDMVKEVIGAASHGYSSSGTSGGGDEEKEGGVLPRHYGLYSPGQAFQVAATALTHEAYVRGSTDNIGVCVVDLRPR